MRQRLRYVVVAALIVRLGMIVWALAGVGITPRTYLSQQYFQEGYAIAAGWGYVTASPEQLARLSPEQNRVISGDARSAVERPQMLYGETLHPPGMSMIVATMHRVFGGDASLATMMFGALLDTAATAVLYLFVSSAWSEPIAFVAAMTYAFFLPQAYAATAARTPSGLLSFFVIAASASAFAALRVRGARSIGWFALAGALVGAGGYLRPDYDLLAVGLFPFLWLYARRFRRAAAGSAVMLAVTCGVLFPWAFRNHELYGRWTFTSSAVGSTLVEGLGEFANPWGIAYSDAWLIADAKAHGFASAWTLPADAYFMQMFERDVRAHPGAYVMTIVKRVPLVLAPPHRFGFANPLKTTSFGEQRAAGLDRYQTAAHKPAYVIAAYWDAVLFSLVGLIFLACTGYMAVAERSRLPLVALTLAPHIYSIGAHILTDVEPDYLLPSTFSLMIGFAYCVVALRSRRALRRRLLPARMEPRLLSARLPAQLRPRLEALPITSGGRTMRRRTLSPERVRRTPTE